MQSETKPILSFLLHHVHKTENIKNAEKVRATDIKETRTVPPTVEQHKKTGM